MVDYQTMTVAAKAFTAVGELRTKLTKEPEGQKFPVGSRVFIAEDLGDSMSHFPKGKEAIVEYTYAHAFGGSNVKSYSLNVDGEGSHAWYYEEQLTLLELPKIGNAALKYLIENNEVYEAADETKRFGDHIEVVIGIDKDHTATLTMTDETYKALMGESNEQSKNINK